MGELGLGATKHEILDRVEELIGHELTDIDFRIVGHDEPSWRNKAAWERNVMREGGLVAPSRKRGVWELSQTGFREAATLFNTPVPVNAVPRTAARLEAPSSPATAVPRSGGRSSTVTLRALLRELISNDTTPGHYLTLAAIYARYEADCQALQPTNGDIRASMRRELQVLRDEGFLEFLGRGEYRRW